jgi:hypothetical protein
MTTTLFTVLARFWFKKDYFKKQEKSLSACFTVSSGAI